MTISREEAGEQLAEIDGIVERVKQSRIYRVAGEIIILWGVVELARFAFFSFARQLAASWWMLTDAVGIVLTLVMLYRARLTNKAMLLRVVAAFALFYAFGWIWSDLLGGFAARQQATFWPTLFLFGYALAGLWFGAGFFALGVGLTALILAGYVWAGDYYWTWLAITTGGGFIACGYWMRRA